MDYAGSACWSGDYTPAGYIPKPGDTPSKPERLTIVPVGAALAPKRLTIVAPPRIDVSATDKRTREFRRLVNQWSRETKYISDPTEMALHPAYQRIIGMGPDVVPLLIEELRKNGGHWFWALRSITGKDPVPKKNWGQTSKMRQSWLDWWDRQQAI